MNRISVYLGGKIGWMMALVLVGIYAVTAPSNHTEAEDVYDFAWKVEQGTFAEQAGVNRVLALPVFGALYKAAGGLGYSGRAFSFMILLNRLLAVVTLFLFYQVASSSRHMDGPAPSDEGDTRPSFFGNPASVAMFLLAFSYGFWRYANEAELYVLASAWVLGSWCLVLRGNWLWAIVISAVGVLMHVLNLIPLLLIIPLYYLLSKDWKKALFHGGGTALFVGIGYATCFKVLDWGELGAQHHQLEAGVGLANVLRGGIGFGQCLASGNFLFGFDGFCERIAVLFPSRMLEEEFYMAAHMSEWIPWAGALLLAVLAILFLAILFLRGAPSGPRPSAISKPFLIACIAWLVLYSFAIIRTEAGSPELWIMALLPFWLIVSPRLNKRHAIFLITALFMHNWIAGLLPIRAEDSDYHVAKGAWVVEHGAPENLILTDYEPMMIFYLNYFSQATVVSSGSAGEMELNRLLASRPGKAYALGSFFQPMESMRVRSPQLYTRMVETGTSLRPRFRKMVDNPFGGIYISKINGE